MKVPEDLSTETQKKICAWHVAHFNKLIELGKGNSRGSTNVRLQECELYLATWVAGDTALAVGNPMPTDCGEEMFDAVYSGDMDDMLTAEELAKLDRMLEEDEP